MPRVPRVDIAGLFYHVINRANGRARIFKTPADYRLFESLLVEAKEMTGMDIFAYVLMPNHWHLQMSPKTDGDMGLFMHWLTTTHTRRVRTKTDTVGRGHLYQDRYKSFLVDSDSYFLTALKYIERNPVRARLVRHPEDWRWGSSWRRVNGTAKELELLTEPPVPLPRNYRKWVDNVDDEDDLGTIRNAVNRGVPFGGDAWTETMIAKHHLESTRRMPGRPKQY